MTSEEEVNGEVEKARKTLMDFLWDECGGDQRPAAFYEAVSDLLDDVAIGTIEVPVQDPPYVRLEDVQDSLKTMPMRLVMEQLHEMSKRNPQLYGEPMTAKALTAAFIATARAVQELLESKFGGGEVGAPPPPCFCCGKTLEVISHKSNQTQRANDFSTSGQYGSTVFDPMNETRLHVNVCDDCLVEGAAKGRVLKWDGNKYVSWVRSDDE